MAMIVGELESSNQGQLSARELRNLRWAEGKSTRGEAFRRPTSPRMRKAPAPPTTAEVPETVAPQQLGFELPPGFEVRNNIICFRDASDSPPLPICGVFSIPLQVRDVDGHSWTLLLEFFDRDGRRHVWPMMKNLLAGDGAEIRSILLDRGLYLSSARPARAKLMELLAAADPPARARAVDRTGWTDDGVFVLPHLTIGDTPEQRVIYLGRAGADHRYRCAGSLEDWQDTVARPASGNSRLMVAIAFAFVGPLLFILVEEGGGINFRGPSSIGKSTALASTASVWGDPDYVRQWRATSNGLEGMAVEHNETVLLLDELGTLDQREAGSSAYILANGKGKARAGRDGSLRKPATWRVPFLSSGEKSLADIAGHDARTGKRSAAGQEVRILDVEADAGVGLGLFENLHGSPSAEAFSRRIKQAASECYGEAGPEFVRRIIGDLSTVAPNAKIEMDRFVAEHVPSGADGQVCRGARRFALIAAAGELAVRHGILPWAEGETTEACAKVFRQWLQGRGGVGAAEDREAISTVRRFIETHGGSRFEAIDSDGETRIINRAGFWRDGEKGREYLFLAEAWRTEVCVGLDPTRVAKVLAARGLLRQDSAGKNSISVTLPAGIGKTRCYVVSEAIFEGEADA